MLVKNGMYKGKKGTWKPFAAKKWRKAKAVMATVPYNKYGAGAFARTALQRFVTTKALDATESGSTGISANLANNNCITLVNSIETGTNVWNRIADKARMMSLRVRAKILRESARDPTTKTFFPNCLRFFVVWDRQPNGQVPPFNTIFNETDPLGTGYTDICASLSAIRSSRFRVLRDKMIGEFGAEQQQITSLNDPNNAPPGTNVITTSVPAVQQTRYIHVDEYIDLSKLNLVSEYSTSTTGIGAISTGALYVGFKANLLNNNNTWYSFYDANVGASESNFRLRFQEC